MSFSKSAFIDPEENTPLRVLCEYYQNPCHFVFDDMKLDVMFKQFKEGNRGHVSLDSNRQFRLDTKKFIVEF
jgi:hypothetical protein